MLKISWNLLLWCYHFPNVNQNFCRILLQISSRFPYNNFHKFLQILFIFPENNFQSEILLRISFRFPYNNFHNFSPDFSYILISGEFYWKFAILIISIKFTSIFFQNFIKPSLMVLQFSNRISPNFATNFSSFYL